MKKIFLLVLFAFLAVSFFPQSSSAYLATGEKAVKLSDDTFLFTITSRFSYMHYAVHMPILAVREGEYGKAFPNVGYAFYTEDGALYTEGKASAIVLSDVGMVGSEYVTGVSKAGLFTLVAIVKVPKGTTNAKSLHMRTTTQPFTLTREGETIPSQLDEKQLNTYKTSAVAL